MKFELVYTKKKNPTVAVSYSNKHSTATAIPIGRWMNPYGNGTHWDIKIAEY